MADNVHRDGFRHARVLEQAGGGVDISKPVLKPGESISIGIQWSRSSLLELKGYKPGDKIIAVVYGRIANTNNIFKCCAAPFELPPLANGEPSAGK